MTNAAAIALIVALALSACAAGRRTPAPAVPEGVTPLTTEQDRALAE